MNTLCERVKDIHGVWLVASKNIIPVWHNMLSPLGFLPFFISKSHRTQTDFPPLTRNVYMRYYHRYLLRVDHHKTDGAHLIFRPFKTKKSLIFWYVNRRNICIQNSVLFFNFSYLRCRVKINSFLQTRKELVNYLIGFFLQYSRAAKKSLLFCNSRKNHHDGRIWFDKHFVNLHCQEKRTL